MLNTARKPIYSAFETAGASGLEQFGLALASVISKTFADRAVQIGLIGPHGAGKSTLANPLAAQLRKTQPHHVSITDLIAEEDTYSDINSIGIHIIEHPHRLFDPQLDIAIAIEPLENGNRNVMVFVTPEIAATSEFKTFIEMTGFLSETMDIGDDPVLYLEQLSNLIQWELDRMKELELSSPSASVCA